MYKTAAFSDNIPIYATWISKNKILTVENVTYISKKG
jgi:hypothetical protein